MVNWQELHKLQLQEIFDAAIEEAGADGRRRARLAFEELMRRYNELSEEYEGLVDDIEDRGLHNALQQFGLDADLSKRLKITYPELI